MTAKQTDKPKNPNAQALGRMAKGCKKRFTEAYIATLTERLAGARAKRSERLAGARAKRSERLAGARAKRAENLEKGRAI